VWITMMALSDPGGYVAGSVPGLAHQARVPLESCQTALEKLSASDAFSRTKEHEGKRIKVIDGGWMILNYEKHRQAVAEERRKVQNRERARRFREKRRNANRNESNAHVAPSCAKVTTRQKAEGRRQKAEVKIPPPAPQGVRGGRKRRGNSEAEIAAAIEAASKAMEARPS
jgi:hypothetical protein